MQSINFDEIGENGSSYNLSLDRLAKSFYSSKRVVALTGAGISVSAGIPDFRSAGGLYERVRVKYAPQKTTVKGKDFFDVNFFLQPESRPLFFQFIAELKESCAQANPTPTHYFLKDLATAGKLTRWYTQNIDCLEERLGLNCWSTSTLVNSNSIYQNTVVSLHGTLSQVSCTLCKITHSFTPEHLDHFKSGKELACNSCSEASALRQSLGRRKLRSGFLRPDIVLYNEPHPHGDTISDFVNNDISKQPNLLIVMGTSLKIAGLKKMIKDFAKSMKNRVGGENNLIVYVNKTACSKAEWQGIFDFELIGECDEWIKYLQNHFNHIKLAPKTYKISISQLIPSSPLSKSMNSVSSLKKKAISSNDSITKLKSKSKPTILSSQDSLDHHLRSKSPAPISRRIDEFFTPVKSCPLPNQENKNAKKGKVFDNEIQKNKKSGRVIMKNLAV